MSRRPGTALRGAPQLEVMALVLVIAAGTRVGAAPDSSTGRAATRAGARQVLDWCSQHAGTQYIAAGLPGELAETGGSWPGVAEARKWLQRSLGCDVAAYEGLWLVAGRKPRPLPERHASADELREWLRGEVLGPELKLPDPATAAEALGREMRALTERAAARMPAVTEGEVALVPLELRAQEWPALREAMLARAAEDAVGGFRQAAMPLPAAWSLQAAGELMLRDPAEPPRSQITLGPAWSEPSAWQEYVLQRPWGFFWWHWWMRHARDPGGVLAQPVTLDTCTSLKDLTQAIRAKVRVPLDVPDALAPIPVCVRVRDMPLWLVVHGISAVTGAQWGPRRDAGQYELRQDALPASRFYAGWLSVSQRMAWLQREEGGASFAPLIGGALAPDQQERLKKGERIAVGALSPEARDAIERHGLEPLRVSWMRDALESMGAAMRMERVAALIVSAAKDPAVFLRTSNGGWRQYAGPKMLLPVPVFGTDRERRFASALQEYGDEQGIPPRWVFGARMKPSTLVAPRYVAGTAPQAPPRAVLYGRQLDAETDAR